MRQFSAVGFFWGSCLLIGAAGCGKTSEPADVAFVTNGIDPFWTIAEKGALDGAAKHGVKVDVKMPPEGVVDQRRMVEELLARRVKGIAISPIDAVNQRDFLRDVSKKTKLITQDSDSPDCGRICYVGMDNYEAGRMCGAIVKKAMPEGGTVMIFVGRLGQDNAKLRRQGVIDELLDRSVDSKRYDPPGEVLKGNQYEVLDTRTDDFDRAKAKALAQDALVKHPKLGCMVGLFAYNPPILLAAVKDAGKLKTTKIVGFDEQDGTLQGIKNGEIAGTVVQNPYKYGFESMRILAGLKKGDESVLPKDGFLNIPARSITTENVDEFWTELKKLTGKS